MGHFLGDFWPFFWGIFGGFLGDFWGIFGGFLGDFWGIFGGFLGDFWGIFGPFFGGFLGDFWPFFWGIFGPFFGGFLALFLGDFTGTGHCYVDCADVGSRRDQIGLPTETEIWVPKVPKKGSINFWFLTICRIYWLRSRHMCER